MVIRRWSFSRTSFTVFKFDVISFIFIDVLTIVIIPPFALVGLLWRTHSYPCTENLEASLRCAFWMQMTPTSRFLRSFCSSIFIIIINSFHIPVDRCEGCVWIGGWLQLSYVAFQWAHLDSRMAVPWEKPC